MSSLIGGHFGRTRQSDIYLAGLRGRRPLIPFDFAKLEATARRRMSREAYAYVAGAPAGRARSTPTGPHSSGDGSSRGCCATSRRAT